MSEMHEPSAQAQSSTARGIAARAQVPRLPGGVRIADVTTCVLLFVVQAGGLLLALLSFMVLPMTTDNCAYQACGDGKWINYAMWIAIASMAPAALFSCLGIIQLARNRIGFWLPLIGILAQGAILWASWRAAALAGPITG